MYSELIAEVTVETGRSSAMAGGKEGGGRLGKKTTRGRRADVQRPLDVAHSHSSPHRARAQDYHALLWKRKEQTKSFETKHAFSLSPDREGRNAT